MIFDGGGEATTDESARPSATALTIALYHTVLQK